MRVCVLHNSAPGGADRLVTEIVRRLAVTDDVTVCTWGESPATTIAGAEVAWIHGPKVGLPAPLHPFGDLARSFLWSSKAARWVDAQRFDVALAFACKWAQSPEALRRLETPTLYFAQEGRRRSLEPGYLPVAPRAGWQRPLWAGGRRVYDLVGGWLDRRAMGGATAVAANSSFSARQIERAYGRSGPVIPLGVDADAFSPEVSAPRVHALIVCALDPTKGVDLACQALELVPAAHRPPLQIVANRGDLAYGREVVARSDGVVARLRWAISEPELVEAYRTAAVVLALAPNEPFGLTVLEATAAGAPVVAIDSGGYRDTVVRGVTGVLVPAAARDVADAITSILTGSMTFDPAAMRAVARRWSWDAVAQRVRDELSVVARSDTHA